MSATSQNQEYGEISCNGDNLEEKLQHWRKEQFRVASMVVVHDDEHDPEPETKNEFGKIPSSRYLNLRPECSEEKLYGGVDVSFPENDDDLSVAVYVVLRGGTGEVVYRDSETFQLTVPYVSSYLSFREIDPLERLVKKQMKSFPDVTPEAVLVDGNGILHARRAGVACFLGVRTGIPTIGVGKTLYCHDGLDHDLVNRELEKRVRTLWRHSRDDHAFRDQLAAQRGLVMDRFCIDADCPGDGEIEVSSLSEDDSSGTPSLKDIVQELSPLCHGFAVNLRGKGGTTWGAALLGHGGQIVGRGNHGGGGTKNPIFVSVGHSISLVKAVQICAELSRARIPEPVRCADLTGRQIMRDVANG